MAPQANKPTAHAPVRPTLARTNSAKKVAARAVTAATSINEARKANSQTR